MQAVASRAFSVCCHVESQQTQKYRYLSLSKGLSSKLLDALTLVTENDQHDYKVQDFEKDLLAYSQFVDFTII